MAPTNERTLHVIAFALGLIIFAFGFLKLFDPFCTWFHAQIAGSGLPRAAFPLGITGEIAIGLSLTASFIARARLADLRFLVIAAACVGLIVMMLGATYVHLQPNVPARVLPLGIKPPFIPLSFLALACWLLVRVLQLRSLHGGAARP